MNVWNLTKQQGSVNLLARDAATGEQTKHADAADTLIGL